MGVNYYRPLVFVESPCLDCTDRHIKCHSDCEKYRKFRLSNWNMKRKHSAAMKRARDVSERRVIE